MDDDPASLGSKSRWPCCWASAVTAPPSRSGNTFLCAERALINRIWPRRLGFGAQLGVRWKNREGYQAHAYASTRGSAPALKTPVVGSMTMPALEPNDQAGTIRSL